MTEARPPLTRRAFGKTRGMPRKRSFLTHHGGILHYVLRQLAAKKAA